MRRTLLLVAIAAVLLLGLAHPASASTNTTNTAGVAWAWGDNHWGQVGDCTRTCSDAPADVSGFDDFLAIDAGWFHTLALRADGTVWAWGGNSYGQLGDGTTDQRSCPVQVVGIQDVKAIAAGGVFSLALKKDGTVWAWGDNQTYECGICPLSTIPVVQAVQVQGISDVIAIDAGIQHGVALKADGTVWCWGLGLFGILGQGGANYTSSCVPLQVVHVTCAMAIAAGADHTLCLLSDGTIKAWGQGNLGQLGNGVAVGASDPAYVRDMTQVVGIAAGSAHSLALRSDGTVWGWGTNIVGQLGAGPPAQNLLPLRLSGIGSATALGAGRSAERTLVQMEDGSLWLLGGGFCGTSSPPVMQLQLPLTQSFSTGEHHIVALEGSPRPRPPGLSSMRKRTSPFRIEATGWGLQPGFQVFLDQDEAPYAHVAVMSPTQFTIKGGDKLKARVKRKDPFPFRIVNPDGGQVRVLWQLKTH